VERKALSACRIVLPRSADQPSECGALGQHLRYLVETGAVELLAPFAMDRIRQLSGGSLQVLAPTANELMPTGWRWPLACALLSEIGGEVTFTVLSGAAGLNVLMVLALVPVALRCR
jgi:membrane protein YqaA with SNARE-associated domain